MLRTCCTFTRVVRVCAPLLGPLRGLNCYCLWFWQVGFGVSLRAATSNLPSSPNPLSNRGVLHDGRKHTRPSSFHNPTLSANKHVVKISRSSLSAAVLTVQVERRTSPFNGIERLLCCAVVIKTKSLPVSTTTFPTALSLYITHDGRKHKHNPKLSANKHVQICRSSLSAAADGLADCSGERRTSPFNGDAQSGNDIERSLSRVVVPPYLPVSATTFPTSLSLYIAQGRLRKDIRYPSCFSKAEPLPFEKKININLVYFSCLKHVNEMVLGDPRQAHQRTQSFHFHFPCIVIHQSLDPAARALKRQASCLLHAPEQSTGSEQVNASTRLVFTPPR